MKRIYFKISVTFIIAVVVTCFLTSFKIENEPWSPNQLIKAEKLATILLDENKLNDPVILNIGPSGAISGSIEIGPINSDEGIKKFQQQIVNLPKEKHIVVYCGCCPFENCPNIRPAFEVLNKKGFTNHQLLELPQNLKVDWIDKGFPIED